MSDVAPKEMIGLSGGLFNTFGNTAGIVIPIVIGYIINSTGSFNGALVFVGIHAVIAILCYLFMVGKIQRLNLKQRHKSPLQIDLVQRTQICLSHPTYTRNDHATKTTTHQN